MLLFVLWYCYKRGREVRLEKERLAVEGGASAASSINEDADSIFGDKAKLKTKEIEGEASAPPPATVQDLPSVSHLPSPQPAEEIAQPVPVAPKT